MMLFREFDTDDIGYITTKNLKAAIERLQTTANKNYKQLTEVDIQNILAVHDDSKDGKISYEEFCTMMLGEEE